MHHLLYTQPASTPSSSNAFGSVANLTMMLAALWPVTGNTLQIQAPNGAIDVSYYESPYQLGNPDMIELNSPLTWYDRTEQYVNNNLHDLGTYIDHGLAKNDNEPALENHSYIRFRTRADFSHYDNFSSDIKLSMRLHLPHVKKNWKIILDTDPEDYASLESKERDVGNTSDTGVGEAIGGIRIEDRPVVRHWVSHFDLGILVKLPLDPFVRTGIMRVEKLSPTWTGQVRQELFYFESIGAGSRSDLNFYYPLNESGSNFLTLGSSAQYLHNDESWELVEQATVIDRVHNRQLMEYHLGVSFDPERGEDKMTNIWLSAISRHDLRKRRVYLYISPYIELPREHGYKVNPGIRLEFEAFFSKKRNVDRLQRGIPGSTRHVVEP